MHTNTKPHSLAAIITDRLPSISTNLRTRKKFKKYFEKPKGCVCLQLIGFVNNGQNMNRDVFQALADPTRRAIIALIATQALTPNAIAENFDVTRQAVSKHLRILTECELVKKEQQGREIYYQLEIKRMKDVDLYLEKVRNIWEGRHNQLDKLLKQLKTS